MAGYVRQRCASCGLTHTFYLSGSIEGSEESTFAYRCPVDHTDNVEAFRDWTPMIEHQCTTFVCVFRSMADLHAQKAKESQQPDSWWYGSKP
jgi:hypothetical protein